MTNSKRASRHLVLAFVPFMVLVLSPLELAAGELHGNVMEDSEISLSEGAMGPHQGHRITISTKDGVTTLKDIKSGNEAGGSMPDDACLLLWDYVLQKGVEDLEDAQPDLVPPDTSTFTLSFRIGSTSHSFSAAAVDYLSDTRYRDIVREILAVSDRYIVRDETRP